MRLHGGGVSYSRYNTWRWSVIEEITCRWSVIEEVTWTCVHCNVGYIEVEYHNIIRGCYMEVGCHRRGCMEVECHTGGHMDLQCHIGGYMEVECHRGGYMEVEEYKESYIR